MYVNWQFLYDSLALKTHDTHTQLLSLTISISTWRVCWWRGWGRRSRRASCQCLNGAAPPSCGIPVLEFERERKSKKEKRIRVNNLKDIRRQLRRRWKTKRKSRRAQDKTTNVLLYAKVTRPMRDLQERRGPFRSCYDCLLLRYHNSKP